MLITRCDLCKKEIADDEHITAGLGYNRKQLCIKCAAPVLKFLKKHRFVEEKKDKIKNR